MARAPVNALVLPYRVTGEQIEFAVLNRADSVRSLKEDFWQSISVQRHRLGA